MGLNTGEGQQKVNRGRMADTGVCCRWVAKEGSLEGGTITLRSEGCKGVAWEERGDAPSKVKVRHRQVPWEGKRLSR